MVAQEGSLLCWRCGLGLTLSTALGDLVEFGRQPHCSELDPNEEMLYKALDILITMHHGQLSCKSSALATDASSGAMSLTSIVTECASSETMAILVEIMTQDRGHDPEVPHLVSMLKVSAHSCIYYSPCFAGHGTRCYASRRRAPDRPSRFFIPSLHAQYIRSRSSVQRRSIGKNGSPASFFLWYVMAFAFQATVTFDAPPLPDLVPHSKARALSIGSAKKRCAKLLQSARRLLIKAKTFRYQLSVVDVLFSLGKTS